MVFLQAATNDRGPAFACHELVEAGRVQLFLSPTILAEVQDVFTRPKVQRKFPSLTKERVDTFVQKLAQLTTVIEDVPNVTFLLRDPDDLPYLSLAISANVNYVVSRDNDLLDLMKDEDFVSQY